MISDGTCESCGQRLPGNHRQETEFTPGEQAIVFWVCPIIEEELSNGN